jgi:hypothetical protein
VGRIEKQLRKPTTGSLLIANTETAVGFQCPVADPGGQGGVMAPPNVTNVIFFPMSLLIMLLGMSKFFLLASLATIPPTYNTKLF